MTDDGMRKSVEVFDHLGADHHMRHEDEQGNGAQYWLVQMGKDSLAQSVNITFSKHHDGAGGQAQR